MYVGTGGVPLPTSETAPKALWITIKNPDIDFPACFPGYSVFESNINFSLKFEAFFCEIFLLCPLPPFC